MGLLATVRYSSGTVMPSVAVKENTKLSSAASTFREARDYGGGDGMDRGGGYNYRSPERPQSRCISCLYAAMTGNQNRDR